MLFAIDAAKKLGEQGEDTQVGLMGEQGDFNRNGATDRILIRLVRSAAAGGSMSKIEIWDGTMHIEASIVAHGLELHPSLVQAMMRRGEITSLCERGVNEDAGRYRLKFFCKGRRFRLIIDRT